MPSRTHPNLASGSAIAAWEAAGVTTMLVSPGSVAEIERLAAL